MDGSVRAGPRLRDKEGGQGSSSDGIHTEDVKKDSVRGEQSFLQAFVESHTANTSLSLSSN